MSPITYTPHDCETPALGDLPYGTIWQCETCQALWAATSSTKSEWAKIEDPRREHRIEDTSRRVPAQPTTPTVTPRMVQLVIKTYSEHLDFVTHRGQEVCLECDAPLGTDGLGNAAHARNKAAAALQDALAKAGRDAQE